LTGGNDKVSLFVLNPETKKGEDNRRAKRGGEGNARLPAGRNNGKGKVKYYRTQDERQEEETKNRGKDYR